MFTHIIVLPTYSCNCRCPYCYEDHSAVNMTDEVVDSIKRFLEHQKKNGASSIQLEFFGGEPTLQLNTVYSLSQFAKDLFSDPEDTYIGSMTTNGVRLDYPTFKKLNDVGVRTFQITFDGPKPIHDKTRVLANGNGSYDAIMNNLELIRQSDLSFNITIRVHVTPEGFSTVEQFSKNELSYFRSDPKKRFTIFYHPIVPLGGKRDNELSMFATRKEADKALEPLNSKETFHSPTSCYAGQPNSIIILPDGKLSKCTVELDKASVGRLLPDGTVQINNNLFSLWCIGTLYPDEHINCPRDFLQSLKKKNDE